MRDKVGTVVDHNPIGTVAGLLEGRERRHLLVTYVGSQGVLHGGRSLEPAA